MSDAISTAGILESPTEVDHADVNLRELLDHIAVELAHEYIRLMEEAAAAEPE